MPKIIMFCLLMHNLFSQAQLQSNLKPQDWTNYVRIAGHGLNKNNIDATIKDAEETYLFGIEVDNDVTGRYNSFLDPKEKLEDIKLLASRAHAINNYAFVYIAGLECITANADKSEHTFFKDHPDWVQRNINNKPAVFGGGDAFWITKGDEDVWISPYAKDWRKKYMELVRQIAATGIDGIYVDIPYWMTHFDGWENSWASFDDYTVEAFKSKTGLNARKDLKLGDFTDANFRKWIDFRIETLTEFMAEIDHNVKAVNPACKTIAEIYPGMGEEAVRVGSDVYELYNVVDVIAHEFSGGEGNAASKDPEHWFDRMVGMYTFRAFADRKASWMLSYSWDKKNKVKPAEPMKTLALSNLMAGTNNYDAAGHVMSGSNDIEIRKMINKWVATNENTFYKPRQPIAPIGVYFSPKTRNYFADSFISSFGGIMKLMLQGHLEFQIVTPRTLKDFKGEVLILSDVRCVSSDEVSQFQKFLNDGKGMIVSGETGRFDDHGNENKKNMIFDLLQISGIDKTIGKQKIKFMYYPECPGKTYSAYTKKEFNQAAWKASWQKTNFFTYLNNFRSQMLQYFELKPQITIEASPFISTQIALVEGRPHIFLANFSGLKNDEVALQIPEKEIKINFRGSEGAKVFYLSFPGEKQQLAPKFHNGTVTCTLPPVEKGGVVWLEE